VQITFDNLRPETLKALLADPGLPAALRTPISNLIAQSGDDSFVSSCEQTASDSASAKDQGAAPVHAAFGRPRTGSGSFVDSCEQTARLI